MSADKEKLKGTIHKITYQNEQNGYTVAVVRVGRENITVVGTMPYLSEGESAEFEGEYIIHPTFGKQFAVKSFERSTPKTSAAILKYLSSGAIKGVGPGTAIKIIEKFGNNALDIIENHPEELVSISGISQNRAQEISKEYKNQFGIKEIALLLTQYGITLEKCVKIVKVLGGECARIIKDNPYVLCRYDLGISFETAEKIAFDFGIPADDEQRLIVGIEYILRGNLSNGHTCLPKNKIIPVAVKLLDSDCYRVESICDKMIKLFIISEKTLGGETYYSLPEYYAAESYIAARIKAGMGREISGGIDELEIDYVENKLGIKFDSEQRRAICLAMTDNIMVLTGGPGTGKTTALGGIIELFERRNLEIILAAPTGRAAKRITELTGREARTVHRLLEAEWVDGGTTRFARNERNPLSCDVLIIDEASMLDALLFDALLRAVRLSCKIILVGDENQLPSIAAGNVLADLISSGKVNFVSLHKIFRQSKESLIVRNSHAIINGETPDLESKDDNFFFINKNSSKSVLDAVLQLCSERLPKAYGFDPLKDIQVLCPSRKFETGSVNLNNLLQQVVNPYSKDAAHLSYKGIYFYKGDKVMQIKNNYDIAWEKVDGETGFGVYNGDIGYITDVDLRTKSIRVLYEDRSVIYTAEGLAEIEPAFAVTVHKSQGSEFECVIMPVYGIPAQLAYRNLLYTAVTRAKKLFVAVGDSQLFYQMCANDKKTLRYTMLKEFLADEKF